jgi:Rieske Fe-S protein
MPDLTETATETPAVDRRRLLIGGGVVVAAAAVSAACGSSSGSASGGAAGTSVTVKTTDVPVGGGLVVQGAPVVVTQPSAGQFKAFSSVCTHQGCIVSGVQNGQIVCPCHGSTFSMTDGAVTGGPAPTALPAVALTVSGSTITLTT